MATRSRRRFAATMAVCAAVTLALSGCFPGFVNQQAAPTPGGANPVNPANPQQTASTQDLQVDEVDAFITEITTSTGPNAVGVLTPEPLDPSGGGAPPTAPDSATVVNGGSLQFDVSSAQPFSVVFIAASSTGAPGQPTAGSSYYVVDLGEATTEVTLVLTMQQQLPASVFTVTSAVGNSVDSIGSPAGTVVNVVAVGTGDVQVSVQWSHDSDVDLYVVDPHGNTVYYGNQSTPDGGELDLDSNPACNIDGIRNENVTWPVGDAPSGSYEVRLNLYADCGIERTSWVVTVQVAGQVRRWEGVLEAPGLGGSASAGITIAQFEVP